MERKIVLPPLKRTDTRARWTASLHRLNVHTIDGAITTGEPIMPIAARSGAMIVGAKFQSQDIGQVRFWQKALLRFFAFNQRTTPNCLDR
ncbi:MAG TPA: hypothetical protein VGN12_29820 [Pirellulales bacterium]|jgi:HlyD family secretion protein